MTVNKVKDGSQMTVYISGRVDTITAPELEAQIDPDLGDLSLLTLDFTDVSYISSAGLRILLTLQKKLIPHGSMKIVHANDAVYEIFNVTGFTGILDIEKEA